MTSDIRNPSAECNAIDISALTKLERKDILKFNLELRMQWFKNRHMGHRNLLQVMQQVNEVLRPHNGINLVAVVGMTGIGKSTMVEALKRMTFDRYRSEVDQGFLPIISVEATENGNRTMSWKSLYKQILNAGGEWAASSKRAITVRDGKLSMSMANATVDEYREFIEEMVHQRRIRYLVIDEALHLLRHDQYERLMDTLKSLANIAGLKVILVGPYDLGKLILQYGQTARRGKVIEFAPYEYRNVEAVKTKAVQPAPIAPAEGGKAPDAWEFYYVLQRRLQDWPNEDVPPLLNIWATLMEQCCGSIGILSGMLLQLAALQDLSSDKKLTAEMFVKASLTPNALMQIRKEHEEGVQEIASSRYVDANFQEQGQWISRVLQDQRRA